MAEYTNSLSDMLNTDTDGEPQLLHKSNYFDDASLARDLSTRNNSFNILSLNWQSIKAKIDELRIKLKQWKNLSCTFDAICLQET